MLRESHSAVLARNEEWRGEVATEPYEAGWALEAVIFLHALHIEGNLGLALFRVQISPDGMHWVNEGSTFYAPSRTGDTRFVRVNGFGNWLRIVGTLPDGALLKPLVTFCLKG